MVSYAISGGRVRHDDPARALSHSWGGWGIRSKSPLQHGLVSEAESRSDYLWAEPACTLSDLRWRQRSRSDVAFRTKGFSGRHVFPILRTQFLQRKETISEYFKATYYLYYSCVP